MPSAKKLPSLARQAVEDPGILQRLVRSLRPDNTYLREREGAVKALLPLAQAQPE